jgi:integrase/recombinase XerD
MRSQHYRYPMPGLARILPLCGGAGLVPRRHVARHSQSTCSDIHRCSQRPQLGAGSAVNSLRDGKTPADLRARAMLLLYSIYALRSSEVARLRLDDFDWRNETFTLRRSKRGGIQQYPIQYEVGEAILEYLQNGRPRCACRHVFLTLQLPYRPLSPVAMWSVVGKPMRRMNIECAHVGPHSLRHACATHLLKKGSSYKEIAEFLGHQDTRSVGLYAKFDKRSLLKVAAVSLAGLR